MKAKIPAVVTQEQEKQREKANEKSNRRMLNYAHRTEGRISATTAKKTTMIRTVTVLGELSEEGGVAVNDNDIKKDLMRCANKDVSFCEKCLHRNYDTECCIQLLKDALDLINRQKAEIERLLAKNKKAFDNWLVLDKRTKDRYAELYEEAKGVVRAEAIKEFAGKVKDHKRKMSGADFGGEFWDEAVLVSEIDSLVKEMTEVQHGEAD